MITDVTSQGQIVGRRRPIQWPVVLSVAAATGVLMATLAVSLRLLNDPAGRSDGSIAVALLAHNTITGQHQQRTSLATAQEWYRRAQTLKSISGYAGAVVYVRNGQLPQRIRGAEVAPEFFRVLGVSLQMGRGFTNQDFVRGPVRPCIVSDTFWRQSLGGDRHALGRRLDLDVFGLSPSGPYEVVGVAAQDFQFPDGADVWLPLFPPPPLDTLMSGQWFTALGRLRAGVSLTDASADLARAMDATQADYPNEQPTYTADIVTVRDLAVGTNEPMVGVLAVSCGLLILAVGTSAGAMLTAAAIRRQRDDAIRIGLGASPRLLVSESAWRGLFEGLIAFVLAVPASWAGLYAVSYVAASDGDAVGTAAVSWPIAIGGLVIAMLLSVALGVLARAPNVLQKGPIGSLWGVGITTHRRAAILRASLVTTELLVTTVAAVMAVGVMRRISDIGEVRLGFDPSNLLVARVDLPPSRYTAASATQWFDLAQSRLRALPGVTGVALASDEPLFGMSSNPRFVLNLEGRALSPPERIPVIVSGVSSEYFSVLKIPLLTGDVPEESEQSPTAVVNETFARLFYAGRSPVGRRLRFGGSQQPWWTIVGVAASTRNEGPLVSAAPAVYMARSHYGKSGSSIFIRVAEEDPRIARRLHDTLQGLDRMLPISAVLPARDYIARAYSRLQVSAFVLTAVASTGMLLSYIGLFGVLSSLYAQKRPEVAMHICLGATRPAVARLLLRPVVRTLILGIPPGLLGGILASRVAERWLGEVPMHVQDLATVAVVLGILVVSSSARPLLQVARTPPSLLLREI